MRNLTTPDWQVPLLEDVAKGSADQHEAGQTLAKNDPEGCNGRAADSLQVTVDTSAEAESKESAQTPSVRAEKARLPSARRKAVVNLTNPEYVIMVSALKGVCGISCVRGFDEGKKFNIQTLSGGNQPDTKQEAAKAAKKAAEDAAREEMLAEEAHHRNQAAAHKNTVVS